MTPHLSLHNNIIFTYDWLLWQCHNIVTSQLQQYLKLLIVVLIAENNVEVHFIALQTSMNHTIYDALCFQYIVNNLSDTVIASQLFRHNY